MMPGTRASLTFVLLSRHSTLVCINCGVGALETRILVTIGDAAGLGHVAESAKNPRIDAPPHRRSRHGVRFRRPHV